MPGPLKSLVFVRILTLCCILFGLQAVQAQSRFSYGVSAGYLYNSRIITSYKSAMYRDYRNSKETGLPGISAEVLIRYRLNDKVGFETGLGYAKSGYAIREERLIDPGFSPLTSGYYSELFRYVNKNVTIPLNLSYSTKKRLNFRVTAGPAIFIPISENVKWILREGMGRSKGQEVHTRKSESKINRVNLAFNLGVGFGCRLNEKLTMLLQPKVVYDLSGGENTDIRDNKDAISLFDNQDVSTREHQISFGLTLVVLYPH
jgi:hypothetical protein